MEDSQKSEVQIVKSPRDLNHYELFTLENGLQCLLIQDNNQREIVKGGNMSSVSLSVNVGSLNDPHHRPGFAHFLEHMIFMGSSKYPNENDFSFLISAGGGHNNAFTEWEFTNYQFKIELKELYQALDMFAWLLTDPLIKQDAQEREIKAVNSEFESNFPYDSSRRMQLLCSNVADPQHPANRFAWGNIKSLTMHEPQNLLSELKEFYQNYYSADRMKLAIQVKTDDNLVELRNQVTKIFSVVPNKKLGLQDFSTTPNQQKVPLPYEGNEHEMIVFESVKDSNTISLVFTFHKNKQRDRQRTLYLISCLIDHEGKGSLYQYLKKQELIQEVAGGEDDQFKTIFTAYHIDLKLTNKGLQNHKQVLAAVFKYLEMVKQQLEGMESTFKFFQEIQNMGKLGFQFYKVPDQLDNVQTLADEMLFTQDIRRLVKDTYSEPQIDEINQKDVALVLGQMTIDACKVVISAKDVLESAKELFGTKNEISKVQKEKWFKTKFQLFKKDTQAIRRLMDKIKPTSFVLPRSNPLIPEDFSMRSKEERQKNLPPSCIKKIENQYEVWHLQDCVYKMPRAVVQVLLIVPNIFDSPKKRAQFGILTDSLIEQVTSEIGYEAVLADVDYSIKSFENIGFKLKFAGYNDKLANFVSYFFDTMLKASREGLPEWLLNLSLERELKVINNANIEVDQRTSNNRLLFMYEHQYHAQQIAKELQNFDVKSFNRDYLGATLLKGVSYMKFFIAGNIEQQECLDLSESVFTKMFGDQGIQKQDSSVVTTQVSMLKEGEVVEWDCVHQAQRHDEGDEDSENESMEDLSQDVRSRSESKDINHSHEAKDKGESSEGEESKDVNLSMDVQSEEKQNNSCIQVYFQGKETDLTYHISLLLLESLMEENCFDSLRNQEQLGYYVGATKRISRGIPGILFTVESAEYDPLFIQARIFKFIRELHEKLQKDEEMFKQYFDGLVARKKEGFKDIKEEASYLFGEMKDFSMTQEPIEWQRIEKELDILENHITRQHVIKVFEEIFLNNPRIAIFRVFSEKYKHLANCLELEERAQKGEPLRHKEGRTTMVLNS